MRPLIFRKKKTPRDERAEPPELDPQAAPFAAIEDPGLSVAQKAARAALAARGGAIGSEAKPARPAAPRDPAPSRAAYRLHRLWLTPFFRIFLRAGVPMMLTFALGFWYLGNNDRISAIRAGVMDIRRSVETRPEFMVQLVAVEGVSPAVAKRIRADFPIELPISSFDLDLDLLQAEISELDMIESAALRIRPGGVLEIALTERVPAVVWRSRDGLLLLDAKGNRISELQDRTGRADLPLLAGAGAQDDVAQALKLIHAAAPIGTRLRGLVRVGQRRWDVALVGDISILLPEEDPVSALQQVIALDQAQDLLSRDLSSIDMRNPLRPTLRLAPMAQAEMRRIKAIELGDPLR